MTHRALIPISAFSDELRWGCSCRRRTGPPTDSRALAVVFWLAPPGSKIAARGIWGSSDWCASTLHNRHTGRGHGEFEMSGDPGRCCRSPCVAGCSQLTVAADASPRCPCPAVDIFHKIRKFDWYRTAMLISPATCRQFDKVRALLERALCAHTPGI